jgi:hypothetical protein
VLKNQLPARTRGARACQSGTNNRSRRSPGARPAASSTTGDRQSAITAAPGTDFENSGCPMALIFNADCVREKNREEIGDFSRRWLKTGK